MTTTITIRNATFAEAMGVAEKPTPKAPGHWRCVLWLEHPDRWLWFKHAVALGNNEFLAAPEFPSEEIADEMGREAEAAAAKFYPASGAARYVRAEYFPDYPRGGD